MNRPDQKLESGSAPIERGEENASEQPAGHGGPLRNQSFVGGKFRILKLLGTGGMGAVYKVKHEMLDQIFAIKVLDKGASADEKVIRRFDQKAKAAGTLKHVNLIGVQDYGVTDDGIV